LQKNKEIVATKKKSDLDAADTNSLDDTYVKSEDEEKLDLARKKYDTLLLKYTKKHPDVLKAKRTIEKLEKTITEKNKKQKKEVASGDTTADGKVKSTKTAKEELLSFKEKMNIQHFQNEINKIQSDIKNIQSRMRAYQSRVEETPSREQELQSLQRDYVSIQEVYNSLLDRKLEAELSVNMEKKQKGEQFRILDHARLPEKPFKPNVKLLFLITLATGFGIGGGITFLKETFDTSVKDHEQIEKDLGLPILASIPPIKLNKARRKEKIELVFFALCVVYTSIFLTFFAIINYKGLDRTINFIKMHINF